MSTHQNMMGEREREIVCHYDCEKKKKWIEYEEQKNLETYIININILLYMYRVNGNCATIFLGYAENLKPYQKVYEHFPGLRFWAYPRNMVAELPFTVYILVVHRKFCTYVSDNPNCLSSAEYWAFSVFAIKKNSHWNYDMWCVFMRSVLGLSLTRNAQFFCLAHRILKDWYVCMDFCR